MYDKKVYHSDIERLISNGCIAFENTPPQMRVYSKDDFIHIKYCLDSGCSRDEDGFGEEPSTYIVSLTDRNGNLVEPFSVKYGSGWG